MSPAVRSVLQTCALGATYFAAQIGELALTGADTEVTLVSPAAGIALAGLVLWGLRHFPGVAVGACAAALYQGLPGLTALYAGLGSTIAAVCGAWLLSRPGDFEPALDRVRDVFRLIFPVALGSPAIAAAIGTASLLGGGAIAPDATARTAIAWWAGDALGILLLAPLVFTWARAPRPDWRVAEALAKAALFGVVPIAGAFLFESTLGHDRTLLLVSFLLFPLAVWPAMRFPMREIATFNVALSVAYIGGAWLGLAPFKSEQALTNLIALHGLLGSLTLTTLLLAAVQAGRRAAAGELRASEARFRSLTGLSADGYWEQDQDLRFTQVSRGFANMLGFSAAECLGKRLWELPLEQRETAGWTEHRRRLEARAPFRDFPLVRRRPDGALAYGLTSGEPIFDEAGAFRGYRGVGRDITARTEVEAELRESRELFARLFDDGPVPMMFRRLVDGVVTAVNDAWCRLYGRGRDDVIGRPVEELRLIVDPDASRRAQARLVAERSFRDLEVKVRVPGGVREVLLSAETVLVHATESVIITTVDVTERNRAMAELAASRERLHRMFEASPLPVAISGLEDGTVVDVNPAWSRTFGYARDEIVGRDFVALGLWIDLDARVGLRERLRALGAVRNYECRWRKQSGEAAEVLLSADLLEIDGTPMILSNAIDVTDRKLAETRLRESEARFVKVFRSSPVPVVLSRLEDGRYLEVNDAWTRWSGYAREEAVGLSSLELGIWAQPAERAALIETIKAGSPVRNREARFLKRTGEVADVLLSVETFDLGGEHCLVTSVMDITESKHAERQLRESERRFRDFAEAAGEYLWELDVAGRFTYVSNRIEQVLGYRPDELLGRRPMELMPPGEAERVRQWFAETARTREAFRNLEHRSIARSGAQVWQLVSGVPIVDGEGRFVGYRGTALDITERKQAESRIADLATRDPLTGLPNRLLLGDRLSRGIAKASREGGALAVMFMDLDHFKRINDTLGHEVGDALLREVARRVGGVLRKNDTLSRLGGDEFVVLLEGLRAAEDAGQVAQKILNLLAQPYQLGGNTLTTGGSIGIAIYPADGADTTTLMRHADTAMYVAKSSGRKNYQFFSAEMNERAAERQQLESDLRGALERGELRVAFQPRVDIESGALTGAEALLRWQHPAHGLLPAARFLPVVEESGLIHSIGEWVLQAACEHAQGWHAFGTPPFAIAVNIAAKQLNRSLVGRVRAALEASGLEPQMLEVELTESALGRNSEEARTVVSGLRAIGVRIVVDDFGTSYSSLSQLRRFAIDGIKIDRSFVRAMITSHDDRIVVKAMIDMARSLRINTIAEGVETQAELDLLRAMGCEEYAGHLLAEPMPAAEFERGWLRPENVFALRPRR